MRIKFIKYCPLLFFLIVDCFLKAQVKYFPDRLWSKNLKENKFIIDWYSQHLVSMKEPSLWKASKLASEHEYRFYWLRTFHSPISIRLRINSLGTGSLFVKQTNGQGGYGAGNLIVDKEIKLDTNEVHSILNSLQSANFWKMPTRSNSDLIGTDGAQWIIEGVKNGKYHLVDRWSPNSGTFRDAALLFFKLSTLKIETDDIY